VETILERLKKDIEDIVQLAQSNPDVLPRPYLDEQWYCVQQLVEKWRSVQFHWRESTQAGESHSGRLTPKVSPRQPESPKQPDPSSIWPPMDISGTRDSVYKDLHERLSRLRVANLSELGNLPSNLIQVASPSSLSAIYVM
jgi:hypothetical protein